MNSIMSKWILCVLALLLMLFKINNNKKYEFCLHYSFDVFNPDQQLNANSCLKLDLDLGRSPVQKTP